MKMSIVIMFMIVWFIAGVMVGIIAMTLIENHKKDKVIASNDKKLNLHFVSVSLPSREDYDKRQLKPMYFTKDTSVGNSVLFIKGDEYDPYNWNYSRMIDYLKEGRLGYER